MKAISPNPERREKWISRRAENGIAVLICNPRLLQTVLSIYEFSAII